jgi:hypothetical protein
MHWRGGSAPARRPTAGRDDPRRPGESRSTADGRPPGPRTRVPLALPRGGAGKLRPGVPRHRLDARRAERLGDLPDRRTSARIPRARRAEYNCGSDAQPVVIESFSRQRPGNPDVGDAGPALGAHDLEDGRWRRSAAYPFIHALPPGRGVGRLHRAAAGLARSRGTLQLCARAPNTLSVGRPRPPGACRSRGPSRSPPTRPGRGRERLDPGDR